MRPYCIAIPILVFSYQKNVILKKSASTININAIIKIQISGVLGFWGFAILRFGDFEIGDFEILGF